METEPELSPNFYEDSASTNRDLQVATVANSSTKHVKTRKFKDFTFVSSCNSEGPISWREIKERKPEDVTLWCDFETLLGLITSWCLIRVRHANKDHMKILQSYLNEYKQVASMKKYSSSISNKMLKYIIGSCFKKMSFRAFYWASCYMIGTLSSLSWNSVPSFPSVPIKADGRLSRFLKSPFEENSMSGIKTFRDWVMAYNPSDSPGNSPSLDIFLDPASHSSTYPFTLAIATIFHSLLLSSIYTYICSIKQIKFSISKGDNKGYQKYVGEFCNAIRILYLVSLVLLWL